MSLTEIIDTPPLNQVIVTQNGVAEANVVIKSLHITKQKDGTTSLFVQRGDMEIRFILDRAQCVQLAELLAG